MADELNSLRERSGRLWVWPNTREFPFYEFTKLKIEAYNAASTSFWRTGDALFVLAESDNFVEAALIRKLPILGVLQKGGYAKKFGTCVIVVPDVELSRVEAHTNDFQTIILNAVLSHPLLHGNSR